MTDNALAGGEQHVCGDEPTGIGIVIAGLQIVPLRLGIVDVATVTERLVVLQSVCQGARRGDDLPPTVIGVFYHGIAAAVNQFYDIVLGVADVVVGGEGTSAVCRIVYRNNAAACIIAETKDLCSAAGAYLHADEHRTVVAVLGHGTVYGLTQAEPIFVVYVGCAVAALSVACELLAFPRERLAEIARGVAHGVIGDGAAVVGGEQILPLRVGIAVSACSKTRSDQRAGGIHIPEFLRDIAPFVILIEIGGIVGVAGTVIQVLPDKLVCRVILIRILLRCGSKVAAATPDLSDVAICIVGVAVGVIRAVLKGRNERCLGAVGAGNVGQIGLEYVRAAVLDRP